MIKPGFSKIKNKVLESKELLDEMEKTKITDPLNLVSSQNKLIDSNSASIAMVLMFAFGFIAFGMALRGL